jgi:hypothetical protein
MDTQRNRSGLRRHIAEHQTGIFQPERSLLREGLDDFTVVRSSWYRLQHPRAKPIE